MDLEMQDICCGKLSRECLEVLRIMYCRSLESILLLVGVYMSERLILDLQKGVIEGLPSITSAVSELQDIATSPFTNTNLNYDLHGAANSSRTSGNETASRLDTLIALLRAIIEIIDGKPSGDVSERELIRALRDMGVVFE